MKDSRQLIDLISVGKPFVEDFHRLGITEVDQLVGQDATNLFVQLQNTRGEKMDICCQDVFNAAIAQAEHPDLPDEQCKWPYWSKVRKAEGKPQ